MYHVSLYFGIVKFLKKNLGDIALSSSGDFELGIFSNTRIFRNLSTIKDGLNGFYIKGWTIVF